MITLYGVYRSRAARALWLLDELALPFRHVPVVQAYRLADPQAADAPLHTASAEFVAVNPMGQIPAMTDGDLLLTESLAITMYLAGRDPGGLGPRDAAEAARMVNEALFAATAIETPALAILYAQGGGTPDPVAEIAAASETLRRPFARLEGVLATQDWLVGGRFSVADLNTAECVRYGAGHAPLMAGFPHLTAWLARCQARPAFAAMWAARMAEPA